MASSPLYESLPLNAALSEIRLLQFRDEGAQEVLQCTMAVYSMDTKYQALSYEWGVEGRPKQILVNGYKIPISQNLHTFLQLFHRKLGLIWIDQLCIDQNHLIERNEQVQRMGLIFGGALKTWVWLGQDCHNGSAVKLIQSHKLHRKSHQAVGVEGSSLWRQDCHDWALSLDSVLNVAYGKFCQLTYWNRQWIVQEIALSRSITLLYGFSEIDYDDVVQMHLGIHFANADSKSLLHVLLQSVQAVKADSGVRDVWKHAMLFASKSLCKDPRDKVFGLQAILDRSLWTTVDYSKSPREVFLEAAQKYFGWSELCDLRTDNGPRLKISAIAYCRGIVRLAIGMDLAIGQLARKDRYDDDDFYAEHSDELVGSYQDDTVSKHDFGWLQMRLLLEKHMLK